VPAQYIRKQTIANGERFITPELKEMEGKILGAEERSIKLEYRTVPARARGVLARLPEIQRTAGSLAQLDVLASFAETARLYNYCRPQVGAEGVITIRDGRHPVLEQNLSEERFVPNDTGLASSTAERGLQPASASETKAGDEPDLRMDWSAASARHRAFVFGR